MAPEDVVEVPYTLLTPETLRAVIEEFVTRDTTDYGAYEKNLEEKVADVMRQLERGQAKIVFAPEEQRAHIVPERCSKRQYKANVRYRALCQPARSKAQLQFPIFALAARDHVAVAEVHAPSVAIKLDAGSRGAYLSGK